MQQIVPARITVALIAAFSLLTLYSATVLLNFDFTEPEAHVASIGDGTTANAVMVVLQDGLNGYTGTRDAHLYSFFPDCNYGSVTELRSSSGHRPLSRFAVFQSEGDLIGNGATIQSAKLSPDKSSFYNYTYDARRIQKDWVESAITWNNARVETNSTPGLGAGDIAATADGQGKIPSDRGSLTIDVTPGVQAFASGSANYGWYLLGVSGNNNAKIFYSSENITDPALRAKLEIIYTLPPGSAPAPAAAPAPAPVPAPLPTPPPSAPLSSLSTTPALAPSSSTRGWSAIPNTRMRDVCPPNTAEYNFKSKCHTVLNAWSGGAFDTLRNRLVLWGGGHGDYYGNELYALDLNLMKFQRLTDPSPGFVISGPCVPVLPDGNPVSRHTYNGLAYLEHVDKLFAFGGSLACGSGGFGTDTWTFDFKTSTWLDMKPTGTFPGGSARMTHMAYDPVTKKVYGHTKTEFFVYDYDTNHWQKLKAGNWFGGHSFTTATIDPARRKFVLVGGRSEYGAVHVIDLAPGSSYAIRKLATTGDTAILNSRSPGVTYDPVRDRIVAWDGSSTSPMGQTVFSLNLDTKVWSAETYAGGPSLRGAGAFGKWRYVPKLNAIVVVNSVDENAFLFRSGGTSDVPTPPPPASR